VETKDEIKKNLLWEYKEMFWSKRSFIMNNNNNLLKGISPF
jgi:hypothetical protein